MSNPPAVPRPAVPDGRGSCRRPDRRHLLGAVLDDQGLALPGATVTFTNLETGFVRTDVTDTQGRFRAAALPPGVYSITAELAGFAKSVREKVPLTLGQELTVNMTMKVATVEETVTVTAARAAGRNHQQHAWHDGEP